MGSRAVGDRARALPPLFLAVLAGMLLFGAMFWAGTADAFRRIEFRLRTAGRPLPGAVAVLPKPQAKFPVVVYLHDSGESMLAAGPSLRRFAELGVAAIGLEYEQKAEVRGQKPKARGQEAEARDALEAQFTALLEYLHRQKWADTNHMAWVGVGVGAERALSLALRRPELQPRLLVAIEPEIRDPKPETRKKAEIRNPNMPSGDVSTRPAQVLLVHSGSKDCQRLAEQLRAAGMPVTLRVLPQLGHGLGEERGVVMRAVAEYCAAQLPPADYWSEAGGQRAEVRDQRSEVGGQPDAPRPAPQSQIANRNSQIEEAARFNLAMRRAGKHRRELWRAVTALGEPERHTVMTVIGGLEDYDLAHITAGQLKSFVRSAWRARRKYPWCRDTPLEVFEKFAACPRIFEEPFAAPPFSLWQSFLPRIKYCHSTAQASDAAGAWLYDRMRFRTAPTAPESTVPQMLNQEGRCKEAVMRYIYLCRLIGLATRPDYTIWPTLGGASHFFCETWSAEEKQWHPVDCSYEDRTYNTVWMLRVNKAAILSSPGERGGWNALKEQRWEAFTNTIGLFYPSGRVVLRVLGHGQPAKGQRVLAQVWLDKEIRSVTAARTDASGEATLTLGQSALHPYRLVIDAEADSDWQWLGVQAGQTYTVSLSLENRKPFDKSLQPPPLGFPNWKGNSAP